MGQGDVVGREAERQQISTLLRGGSGVVLVGPAGVGKSELASAAADQAAEAGEFVVRVRATVGSSELPLAAFAGWLQTTEQFLTPMLTEIIGALRAEADGRPTLLVVDDIDLLDDTSSVLVHQLLATGTTRLLATMRQGRILPGDVADLRARGQLASMVVGPLSFADASRLADHVAGGALSDAGHRRLYELAQGNPLYTRVLLASARDAGLIVGGEVVLPTTSPLLADVVANRLAGLDERQRTAMLHVAFAEPCGPGELRSVADDAVLAELEAAQLIATELDGNRLVLRLSHPLWGEVLRAGTSHLQRRIVLGTLARDLEATGARRRSDVVKLARLALDGSVTVDPELIARAVSISYAAGDMVLAERLARPEFERSGSLRLGWDLANAVYTLGDLEAVRSVAAELAERAEGPSDRMAAAMISASGEYWIGGDLDGALAIVDGALEHDLADGGGAIGVTRDELRAARAMLLSGSGSPRVAEREGRAFLDLPLGPAYVRGALTYCGGAYAVGRGQDAVDAMDRAVEAFAVMGEAGIALSRRTVVTNRAIGHYTNGHLDLAAEDAAAVIENAISEQQLSLGYLLSAVIETTRGLPSKALPLVAAADQWWSRGSAGGLARRWVLSVTAFTAGTAGELALASATLDQFDRDAHPNQLLDFLAEVGRARHHVARADPEAARQGLEAAIDRLLAQEHLTGTMLCAYELLRLDRPERAAEVLRACSSEVQGDLWPTFLAHAEGVVAGDAAQIASAADVLDALGFVPFAADAASHAADAARRSGDQRLATRLVQRATELRARCDHQMPSATVAVDLGPVALTRREREIGLLAAQGLPSREIGERLFISPRTVDNHLAKVFDKLGIRSRGELPAALST